MRISFRKLCLGLCCLLAVSAFAEDEAKPAPRPRKRLGADTPKTVNKSDGEMTVGKVQPLDMQYINTFQNRVISQYNESTRRLADEPTIHERSVIRITVDTETGATVNIQIEGNLTERRRLLLLNAISQACREVKCPVEIKNKYGKQLSFWFDMIADYHRVKN
jgi:hypothetical protein